MLPYVALTEEVMTMGPAATSQLNVRMESELRAAGDAVLERVGVTPAEVVRALWAKLAKGAQECERVLSVLSDEDDATTSLRGDELVGQIEGWHSQLFSLAGVDRADYAPPTDEELDEMLYDEWLARDGGTVAP